MIDPTPEQLAAMAMHAAGTPDEAVSRALAVWRAAQERLAKETEDAAFRTEMAELAHELDSPPEEVACPTEFPVKLTDTKGGLLAGIPGKTVADRTKRLRDYLRNLGKETLMPFPAPFDDDDEPAKKVRKARQKVETALEKPKGVQRVEDDAQKLMQRLRDEGLKSPAAWARFMRGFAAWWKRRVQQQQVNAGKARAGSAPKKPHSRTVKKVP